MSIDAQLRPGLEAYENGRFVPALVAWEEPWKRLEGDEKALCLALVRIAGALHHHRAGRAATAEKLREEALSEPPEIAVWRRIPLGSKIRFAAFLLFLLAVALAFRFTPFGRMLEREVVIAFMERLRDSWWAPAAHVGFFALIAPMGLPVSPLILAGGVVFGLAKGSLVNAMGTIVGCTVSYQLARILGRDFVLRVVGDKLDPVETFVRRHGFWSLVGIRFMPIPFPVVNFGQALAGVPWSTYIVTSSLGLVPAAVVYTYFATALWETARTRDPGAALGLFLAVLLVGLLGFSPTLYRIWERRRRYRRLVEERRRRRG